MKNIMSTDELVKSCSDKSDSTHHVIFASSLIHAFATVAKKAVREGLGDTLWLRMVCESLI